MTEFENENDVLEGPLKTRKCTDVLCFLVFAAFWVFIFVIAFIGFSKGNLNQIAQPYDSDGFPCGQGDRLDYHFLFINDPFSVKYNENMVCVKSCPTGEKQQVECIPNTDIKKCNDITSYPSYGLAARLCVPTGGMTVDSIKKRFNITYISHMVEDIKDALWILLAMVGISLVICFIWYFMIQYCAGIMITIMLIGSLAALVVFGWLSWIKYTDLLAESDQNKDSAQTYKTTAIVLWCVAGVFLLLILCLISRIRLGAKMIQSAADFITDTPTVMLVPVFFTIKQAAFILLWVITFAYTFSVGTLRYDPGDIFGDMVWTKQNEAFVWILVFALCWGVSFNMSASMFIIASMSAGWYFGRYDGQTIGFFKATCWAFTYHIGTIAFGSFIIAILWFIQLILNYMYQKLKETGQDSFLFKCAMCFVACFERFMRFFNKHAYIESVLRNYSFCPAAAKCIEVLTTNFLRFAVLSGLVELFLFLGTIILSVCITIIGHFILKAYGNAYNIVFETIGPLVVS